MPPRPPVTGGARFLVQQTLGSRELENVFYLFKNVSGVGNPFDVSDLNTCAEDMYNAFVTWWTPFAYTNLSIDGVQAITIDGTETMGSYVPGSPAQGTQEGGAPYTAQVAACVSWPVAAAYRGGHFRTYLAGMGSGGNSSPELMELSFANEIAAAAATFRSTMNAITLGDFAVQLSGLSYVRNKEPRTTPVVFPLGVPNVDTRYASQRRRLGKLSSGSRGT